MPSAKPQIHIVADAEELSRTAAAEFVRRAFEAVHAQGVFRVALAGGSTPKSLYALLAGEGEGSLRSQIPWDKVHFFWGDGALLWLVDRAAACLLRIDTTADTAVPGTF